MPYYLLDKMPYVCTTTTSSDVAVAAVLYILYYSKLQSQEWPIRNSSKKYLWKDLHMAGTVVLHTAFCSCPCIPTNIIAVLSCPYVVRPCFPHAIM